MSLLVRKTLLQLLHSLHLRRGVLLLLWLLLLQLLLLLLLQMLLLQLAELHLLLLSCCLVVDLKRKMIFGKFLSISRVETTDRIREMTSFVSRRANFTVS